MAEHGDEINNKYFEGKEEMFSTSEYGKSQVEEFKAKASTDIFFEDKEKTKFKYFPSTTNLISDLPLNAVSAAGARALNQWQYHSKYVHYSLLTEPLTGFATRRELEIAQLNLVLFYTSKTLEFCQQALERYGMNVKLIDPTNVIPELLEGVEELKDEDIKSKPGWVQKGKKSSGSISK